MGRKKTSRGILLAANLPQLQNLIKRDPEGYREEFLQQLHHFESIRQIFELKPDDEDDSRRFRELVNFLSHVAPCYPKETASFPGQLTSLLNDNFTALSPDNREVLVHNLVLLRNKQVISSMDLLRTLFPLLSRLTSPTLRSFIRNTILADVKTANLKAKNHKLNSGVQAILFTMIERGLDAEVQGDKGNIRGQKASEAMKVGSSDEAMWAVSLAKEFWSKNIWDDAKTVSIVALACFHPSTRVQSAAIHFFLGDENKEEVDSDDDDDVPNIRSLQHKHTVTKKTASGEKKLAKTIKAAKKKRSEKNSKRNAATNFSALQLLHDPQDFGEKLYASVDKYDKRFSLDHKILHIQLLSRVMGAHNIFVLGFYTYIIRYLNYHQIRITVFLASLAQSVHDLTPPEVLVPVVQKLAQEFVHPGVGSEVIAAGINCIREICRRQPWCMDGDLLGDLIEYRKSNDKGVVTAARGLLQLYREVNPSLLKRRERGKAAAIQTQAGVEATPYGHSKAPNGIEGLELLEKHLKDQDIEDIDEEDQWKGWDAESDYSEDSSSGSWVDVHSDGSDVDISDIDEDVNTKAAESSLPNPVSDINVDPSTMPNLAMTKILTPADFAMIDTLRLESAQQTSSSGVSSNKRKLAALEASKRISSNVADQPFLSEMDILGPRKKLKADYAERMESIQKGREGRAKFGSAKGKQKNATPSSSTNREKARQKPLMMILASGAVRSKKMISLREKQRKQRAHIERAKKAIH